MNVLWRAIADPIRGTTPFWKVAVLYSIVGGGILGAVFSMVTPTGSAAKRIAGLAALIYGAYVIVGIHRCAHSCGSAELARIIRVAAGMSLLMVPVLAYLVLTDRVVFTP